MIERRPRLRSTVIILLAVLFLVIGARRASAEGFVSPFIGYNFSGDAGCQTLTNCEDKHANYGVSFGALGSIVGFESEFAWTSDFRGSSSLQSTDVLTFMGNFMIAPKIAAVQPYGLVGAGLIRTTVNSAGANDDENQVGWDIGGGLMVFFGAHVGVRGDLRYFHSFQVLDLSKFPGLPLGDNKLDYGRGAIAVVFKF